MTKPNQTWPDQIKLNQTKKTKPNQISTQFMDQSTFEVEGSKSKCKNSEKNCDARFYVFD